MRTLNLRRPIYRPVAAFGHFGRQDLDLPWECTDKADALRRCCWCLNVDHSSPTFPSELMAGEPSSVKITLSQNVRACAAAVAMELHDTDQSHRGVAVGYDTRFQSENFAKAAAFAVSQTGIPVQISDRPLPTPALSLAVTNMNAAAGIMITASHNPPEWNGFKVKSGSRW